MSQPAAATGTERRTIGDILLSHGYVTERQLDEAAEAQQRTGKPLGQVLVEAGAITRLELASALAEQWSDSSDWMMRPGPEGASDDLESDSGRAIALSAPRRTADDGALAARVSALEAAVQEVLRSDVEASTAPLEHAVADLARRITTWEPTLAELERRTDAAVDAAAFESQLAELAEQIDDAVRRSGASDERLASMAAQTEELKQSLAAAAERIDGAAADAQIDMASLATRLEHQVERSVAERIAGMSAETERLAAEVAELEGRPVADPALASHLDEVTARLDEIASRPVPTPEPDTELASRIEEIAARLPLLADGAALEDVRDTIAELNARPQANPELTERVEDLSRRIDALVVDAGSRVEGDVPEDLRAALEELANRPPVDAALAARVEELATRIAELPQGHDLESLRVRLDAVAADRSQHELSARLDELAVRVAHLGDDRSGDELRALRDVVDELAHRPVGDPAVGDRVWQLSERVDALSDDLGRLDPSELRSRLDTLADRPVGDEGLGPRIDALSTRLDELGRDIVHLSQRQDERPADETWATPEELDELRRTVTESGDSGAARIHELETRFAELERTAAESRARERDDEAPTGVPLPELESRLAAIDEATRGLAAELANTSELWYAGRAALEERLEKLESRVAASVTAASRAPSGSVVQGDVPHTIEQEVERVLMAVERLGLHLSEHDRALAELMSRRGSSKVEELEARLDELETYGAPGGAPALGAVSADGATAPVTMGDTRDLRAELRSLNRQVSELEDTTRADREKLLTQLERMASSIDWRIRRIESGEE
jgi:DNA repair exonuclease SbcCD ATPase subunit